jgi:hypothetical protein
MKIDSPKELTRQDEPGAVLSQLTLPFVPAEPVSEKRACKQCGREFSPRAGSGGKPQRFCSPQCRAAFHADPKPNVAQCSPTCSAPTTLPDVSPPAKKDEQEAAGEDLELIKDR